MEDNWKDCELGDVIELKRGYDLPKSKRKDGTVPIISSSGSSGCHNDFKISSPGVVTGRYGTIGEVFYVEENFWPLNTTLYVKDFKGNDPLFIYYLLQTISFQDYTDKGAVPGINRNHVHKAKVRVPESLEIQRDLGKKLYQFEQRVRLNQQTNKTLEQMAQALFKSWFVDFDPVVDNALAASNPIPDELAHRIEVRKKAHALPDFQPLPEHTRSLFPSEFEQTGEPTVGIGGWVPKGWQVLRADKLASVSIGKTPPRKEKEWFSDIKAGNVIWVSIKDMGNAGVFINESSEYLVSDSINKFNIKVIPKNTVILSFKMTLGRVRITDDEVTTNEAIAHFTKLRLGITSVYLYCQLKAYDFNSLGSTSSIATAVNSKIIKSMPLLVPDESVTGIFSQKVEVLFDRMKALQNNSTHLSKMRDLLLPKLISGDVTVNDAKECNG